MSYSETTKILTHDGYLDVSEIEVGMKVPTPIGDTVITYSGPFKSIRPDVGVVIGNVRVLEIQRFLKPDLTWGIVSNIALTKFMTKTGFRLDPLGHWKIESFIDEVFSFKDNGKCICVDEQMPNEIICKTPYKFATENGVLVIDSFVTEGRLLELENGCLPSINGIPLPNITQKELNDFKNKYF